MIHAAEPHFQGHINPITLMRSETNKLCIASDP